MKTPILGSAYTARSVNAADARMVNLFPEVVPEAGKEPAFLQRAPGLELLTTIGTGPIRGMTVMGAFAYVVSGSKLYRCTAGFSTVTELGTVANDGPVSMANDGNHLFVACNGPSFVYNATTAAFGQITDPDFPGALTVSYLDGYFVFIEPNSQRVWVTSLLDPTSIDPLDFASAEGDPDGLVSSIVDHSEVWLFGTNSIEVWYNSGNADFPLQRIQGAFNEIGCAATFSVAKLDNGLFWLGADARGKGIVYRANGYTGQRISTHAVEWQIQQYENISDAVAYTYQQDGHAFYVLTFPSANATWVYDVSTGAWHERAGWHNGQQTRQRGHLMMSFDGRICVGDYQNGNVYAYSLEVFSDYDRPQRWVRSWRALPTGQNNLKRTAHHSLQLDCEVGNAEYDPMADQFSIGVTGTRSTQLVYVEGGAENPVALYPTAAKGGDLLIMVVTSFAYVLPDTPAGWTIVADGIGQSDTGSWFVAYKTMLPGETGAEIVNISYGTASITSIRNGLYDSVQVFNTRLNPPAITTTNKSIVVAIGAKVGTGTSAVSLSSVPAGYENYTALANTNPPAAPILSNATMMASKFVPAAQTEDPGAFYAGPLSGYATVGITVAVKETPRLVQDPQICLRWSDDGGHTWSREHWVSMGKAGEYGRRVIWRRLGMTQKLRDRVYEISGTDPVKIAIMGAELLLSPTNA